MSFRARRRLQDMACLLRLRGPLRQQAGGVAAHELSGATVVTVLRALETAQPGVRGWIIDERGEIRRHINVYVNGERARHDTPVPSGGVIDVLPAISGG
jgi:molybdopterin synthase sulfur carrier subunit